RTFGSLEGPPGRPSPWNRACSGARDACRRSRHGRPARRREPSRRLRPARVREPRPPAARPGPDAFARARLPGGLPRGPGLLRGELLLGARIAGGRWARPPARLRDRHPAPRERLRSVRARAGLDRARLAAARARGGPRTLGRDRVRALAGL